jgi:protein subunit release factor A
VDRATLFEECRVTYFLSPGPGGQRRDRKRTAVRLVHVPTGITVVAGRRRSRIQNLRDALDRLAEKLEERQAEKSRKPRIATRLPARVKEAILREKRHRALKKKLRGKVTRNED